MAESGAADEHKAGRLLVRQSAVSELQGNYQVAVVDTTQGKHSDSKGGERRRRHVDYRRGAENQ